MNVYNNTFSSTVDFGSTFVIETWWPTLSLELLLLPPPPFYRFNLQSKANTSLLNLQELHLKASIGKTYHDKEVTIHAIL